MSLSRARSFSALQRAEIAEMYSPALPPARPGSFSALQRAEIAEIQETLDTVVMPIGFSALQRAEIAEIERSLHLQGVIIDVSVLFNEPKLLKCVGCGL